MNGRTLTGVQLDGLGLGELLGYTDGRGCPAAAVKVGNGQTSGGHHYAVTRPPLVGSFELAKAGAVLLRPVDPSRAEREVHGGRTLATPAEVDELPERAVIRDAVGTVAENAGGPYPWLTTGFSESWPSEAFAYPVTVLWPLPGAGQ